MRTSNLWLPSVVLLVACGGAQTPPPNSGTEADAAAPTASASASAAPADAGPPAPTIESQREPFISTCMHKMNAQTYCSCAFDQFKDVFKDSDLQQKPSPDQLSSLRQKTVDNCASKLSDADLKALVVNQCVGAEPRRQQFCECNWTALHKKLQAADFLSDGDSPKFDEAKKAVVTECKGKLAEPVAKEDFMGACGKAASQTTKSCECAWKKLRSKASVEQIAVGLVDLKSALDACKPAAH